MYADFIRNSTQRNQQTPENEYTNPRTQHGNRSPSRGGFYEDMRFQAAALEEQRRRCVIKHFTAGTRWRDGAFEGGGGGGTNINMQTG